MMFHLLATTFPSMIYVSFIHRFSNRCWYHFDTIPFSTCAFLNHQKHLFLLRISMILQFWETWFLMIFVILFVASFGIDFWWASVSILGSILGPLWHHILCFWVIVFLMNCWIDCLMIVDQKWIPKYIIFFKGMVPFVSGHFFRTLVPFTHVRQVLETTISISF